MKNKTEKLTIKTFGNFSVNYGDSDLSADSARSGRMWRLFKYFIVNRKAPIPTDKLIDVFWPDESAESPLKALYNLVYRLRNTLSGPFGSKPEFFTFAHNCYVWNSDAPYTLDAEEFDKYVSLASDKDGEMASELLHKAFSLYDGDFLTENASDIWVFSSANYYKRMYGEVVSRLCAIYKAARNYEGIIEVSSKAASIDPLEERYHISLIDALILTGRLSRASDQYEYICSLLDRELSVSPSPELSELNRRIHCDVNSPGSTDLSEITERLSTSDYKESPGAYICDYDSFTKIYQIERRAIERSGQSVFLVSLLFEQKNGRPPSDNTAAEIMQVMRTISMSGLRRGDVLTQYSKSQLLMLLPSATYENCEMVLARLRKSFFSQYHGIPVSMRSELSLVKPEA